jgi:GH15 family glucan-1,4-alpha-glucosidase
VPTPFRAPYSVIHMALPIEDYALIGDSATAALVGRDGSVDWLCLPRFDSPACFAALLGDQDHGRWLLGPEGEYTSTRRYLDDTAVLETTFTTDTGSVRVVDVMPVADGRADLVRRVVGLSGTVRMRHEWLLRTWYGKITPWVTRGRAHGQDVLTAVAGPDRFVLRGTRVPEPVDDRHVDTFDVSAGEELTFATTWVPSHHEIPEFLEFDARIETTIARFQQWISHCTYQGPYRDAVVRSLITLRLMTHGETGGIVAAPTTSLPERFGGVRNWDYRFCWLRDASLTLEALLACGYSSEAQLWRDWLLRAVAGDPHDLQIMYTVDGGRDLPERRLDHLPGYAGSRPVRIGNGAVDQKQTDVLGELMIAMEMARELCVPETDDSWALQRTLVEALAEHWDEPDHGLWEIRGAMRHFTHSRVMVWVAFDRAVRAVEDHGFEGPVERWRALRDEVRAEIFERGYDARRNTFTQHYDTTEVDASLLVLPLVGFIEGDDPRMLGTVEAIEKDLMQDGLLLRYRTETGVDGLPGDEHPFVACSFWLVSAYAKAGRVQEAHELMRRLLGMLNDVGLVSEEYDPVAAHMAGNFPQAFSHLALVGAAVNLAAADPAERDPEAEPTDTTSEG